jgi:uncharacterized protein involved in exopolysaccharide biosynthesis
MHPPHVASSPDVEFVRVLAAQIGARRRRAVVVLVVAFSLSLAALLQLPKTYTATAAVMPEIRRSVANLAAQLGLTVPGAEPSATSDMYAELVRSRQLMTRVVTARYEIRDNGRLRRLTLAEHYAPAERDGKLQLHKAVTRLRGAMQVNADKRTNIVHLAVRTSSAELSLQVIQHLLDALAEANLGLRQSAAKEERSFLESRVAEAKGELTSAEYAMTSFLIRNRSFRESPELAFQHDQLQRQVNLKHILYTTLMQAYDQARLEEVRTTPTLTVIDQPVLPPRPDGLPVVLRIVIAGAVSVGVVLTWALLGVFRAGLAAQLQPGRPRNA